MGIMLELDKSKAYDLRDLSDEQLNEFIKECRKQGATNAFNGKSNKYIRDEGIVLFNHPLFKNEFYINSKYNSETVNALTLFEPQFKQGDKVLVRYYEDSDWIEKVYVVEYNGDHYVKSDYESCLISFKYIKPYEEKSKWYVVGRGVDAYYSVLSEDEVLWSRAEDKRVEEITDPEFIKHLDANAN